MFDPPLCPLLSPRGRCYQTIAIRSLWTLTFIATGRCMQLGRDADLWRQQEHSMWRRRPCPTLPRPVVGFDVTYCDRSMEVMPCHLATISATQPAFQRMGLMFVRWPMEFAKQCVMVTGFRDRGRPCSGVCICVRTWVLC